MEKRSIPYRQMVIDALDLLSSAEEQRQYEQNVPRFDITPEIIASWFSDAYHPAAPEFRASFSEQELETLCQFDAVFKSHLDKLPESGGTVENWLPCSPWQSIMRAAAQARERIAV